MVFTRQDRRIVRSILQRPGRDGRDGRDGRAPPSAAGHDVFEALDSGWIYMNWVSEHVGKIVQS